MVGNPRQCTRRLSHRRCPLQRPSCVCVCARARLFAPNPSRFRYAGFVAGRHAILSDFSVDLLHYVPYFLLRVCLVVNGRS